MMRKILYSLITVLSISLMNCSDDDSSSVNVPDSVSDSFVQKYPYATNVKWEQKGTYMVGEFKNNNWDATTWFTSSGDWQMTKIDLTFAALPELVKNAFSNSQYSKWTIEEVDVIERKGFDLLYIIEVEQQDREVELYYNAEGVLIKTVDDNKSNDFENHLPQPIPSIIETFINQTYPMSRIVDIDREINTVEVDILHEGLSKEVVFDISLNWFYTKWDVSILSLPQAVMDELNKPQYQNYRIDDCEFFEAIQSNYYLIDLEDGGREIKLKISPNGVIVI